MWSEKKAEQRVSEWKISYVNVAAIAWFFFHLVDAF